MSVLTRLCRAGRRATTCTALVLVLAALLAGCSDPAERKQAHMTRGEEYATAGDYEKARVEFSNVLKVDPEDTQARMALADTLERLGNFRNAAGHYQRIIEDRADHAQSRVRLGRIYLLAKQPAKALELADAALKIDPHLPVAYALRGSAHLDLGDGEAAAADAKAALAAGPEDVDAVQFAAGLAGRQGKLAEAIALLEPALAAHPRSTTLRLIEADLLVRSGRTDEAIASLRELVRSARPSQELAARLRLARYLDRVGRRGEAEAALHEAVESHPDDPTPVLALAQFLAARKGAEQAERLLLGAAAGHGAPAPFEKALVSFYRQTGQPEKMEAMLERMIEEHGTTAPGLEARTALAEVRGESHRPDEARTLVEQVLAENPLDKGALSLSAKLALLRGDVSRAIGDLRTVVRDDPNAVEAIWLLGVAYQRNQEPEAAEKQYRRALEVAPTSLNPRLDLAQMLAVRGKLDEALKLVEEGLGRAPRNLPLLAAQGRLQAAKKDWKAVAATARTLEEGHPENAFGYYLAGVAAQAGGDYAQAAKAFERAAELAPENEGALQAMVRSLLAGGHADDALEHLRAAARRQPEKPFALRLQGRLLRGLGRLDESRAVLEQAMQLDPADPRSQRELALTLRAQGDTRGALALIEDAWAKHGDSLLLLTTLGELYDRLGRPDDAIALYESYLQQHPASLPAINNLAMLLATRRTDRASLDRAAALAERLRDSRSPTYLDTLGWVYHQRGEAARAIPVLEDVITLSPDVPSFQFHLGAALIGGGRIEQGREHLDRALSSDAPFPEREDAVAMLESLPSR